MPPKKKSSSAAAPKKKKSSAAAPKKKSSSAAAPKKKSSAAAPKKKKSSSAAAPKKSSAAVRADPGLWAEVKEKWHRGSAGGVAGKWNARKAQLAVQEYKRRGGTYVGRKRADNSLSKWTKEDWGYIDGSRRRYLPKKVRDALTPAERRRENQRKGKKRGEKVPYTASVLEKMRDARVLKKKN